MYTLCIHTYLRAIDMYMLVDVELQCPLGNMYLHVYIGTCIYVMRIRVVQHIDTYTCTYILM